MTCIKQCIGIKYPWDIAAYLTGYVIVIALSTLLFIHMHKEKFMVVFKGNLLNENSKMHLSQILQDAILKM